MEHAGVCVCMWSSACAWGLVGLQPCAHNDVLQRVVTCAAGLISSQIIAPLLRVLEKSHRMNLMHRDIKPENIFLTRASKFKLGDWGLAINWTQEIPFSRSGTLVSASPGPDKTTQCPL